MRNLRGQSLCLATHNRGKAEEISALLQPYGVRLVTAGELGLPEPVETGTTFLENARLKAHAAASSSGMAALADDSGICIDALNGGPGVYTADWAETPRGRDFDLAMTRAWEALETVGAPEPRRAQFRCTLVLAWPDGADAAFEGSMDGRIVWPIRGDQGHGYDPIFQPDGFAVTFGEMDRWQKNQISHRADAFAKLVAGCFT
jgi:XTP/dITP diphosphohydrolase